MKAPSLLSVNGQEYHLHRKSVRLPTSFSILQWLQNESNGVKFYWKSSEDREFGVFGSILELKDPPQFDAENEVNVRFWGGCSFFPNESWDEFPSSIYFLPKIEVMRNEEGVIASYFSFDEPPAIEFLSDADTEFSLPHILSLSHSPSNAKWLETVHRSLEKIDAGQFEKVVLARISQATFSKDLNPFALLKHIPRGQSTLYGVDFGKGRAFIGATPERLYRRRKQIILSEAIAGTRKRGNTPIEDADLAKELAENDKEQREFDYVVRSILDSLKPHCHSIAPIGKVQVLQTPFVQHLHIQIIGELKNEISDRNLIHALHPTAAMGGFPCAESLDFLKKVEFIKRGWFASPIGYSSCEESEVMVAIRSCSVKQNQLDCYAAVGIVQGSDPDKEWEELNSKIQLWSELWNKEASMKHGAMR